jgi:hypothetical protein
MKNKKTENKISIFLKISLYALMASLIASIFVIASWMF